MALSTLLWAGGSTSVRVILGVVVFLLQRVLRVSSTPLLCRRSLLCGLSFSVVSHSKALCEVRALLLCVSFFTVYIMWCRCGAGYGTCEPLSHCCGPHEEHVHPHGAPLPCCDLCFTGLRSTRSSSVFLSSPGAGGESPLSILPLSCGLLTSGLPRVRGQLCSCSF